MPCFLIFILFFFSVSYCHAIPDDKICKEPSIVALQWHSPYRNCIPLKLIYRAKGIDETVDAAQIITKKGNKWLYHIFIVDTKGNILKFNSDIILERPSSGLSNLLNEQLKIGDGPDLLYDLVLENNGIRLCKIAEMKYPLIGELRICEGDKEYQGQTGFSPGILKPEEAKARVCDIVAKTSNQECTFNEIAVFKERFWIENGELFYIFKVRQHVHRCPGTSDSKIVAPPVDIDILEYHVDAQNWKISLAPNELNHVFVKSCNRTKKP